MRSYSFASIISDSQRARWSLDEVAADVHALDFRKPFLPERLVHAEQLADLDASAKLALNHVRAHSYLRLFALVERFILPFAMMHAAKAMQASAERLLALMQFGEEEAKHIALFERFSEAFEFGFGSHCGIVGPSEAVADQVLAEDPLAVGLLVLHIEWMTQDHYTASVRGRDDIDPRFASLLRHHWQEEAQHARIDTLLLDEMVDGYPPHRREQALRAYFDLLERIDGLLGTQVELDLEALAQVAGALPGITRDRLREHQRASYREVFLRAGIEHPRVQEFIHRRFVGHQSQLEASSARWRTSLVA
ncbi:MAG TPA: hypothetical protein VM869_00075 [Enhygromyxa sp.]|nr:hypothetical protein [Enhygromyxa sp.]